MQCTKPVIISVGYHSMFFTCVLVVAHQFHRHSDPLPAQGAEFICFRHQSSMSLREPDLALTVKIRSD